MEEFESHGLGNRARVGMERPRSGQMFIDLQYPADTLPQRSCGKNQIKLTIL
jgi:hypothetical protein